MSERDKAGPHRTTRFVPSAGTAALLALLAALSGCGDTGSEGLVEPTEEAIASPLAAPPTLAEIQSAAGLTAEQTARIKPPHQRWLQTQDALDAEYRNAEPGDPAAPPLMGPGGRELPVITFLEESAPYLDRDEMVRLVGYLGARQEAHKGQWRPPGERCGPEQEGMRGPLADLDLTAEQRVELMQAMMAYGMGMRQLYEAGESGTMTDEQIRDKAKELRLTLMAEMERILGTEKFDELQAERRARMIEQAKRMLDHLGEFYDAREEALIRILQLDESDAAALSGILGNAKIRHEEVLNQFIDGSLEPEDMHYELLILRKETQASIYELLDEEQKAIMDSLERLRPRHPMMSEPVM